MKNDCFINRYNLFIGMFWGVLFFTLWIQFSTGTSVFEAFLFSLGFIICAFAVMTYISRVLLPKAMISRKIKIFVFQCLISIFLLAFLLALIAEAFYLLEEMGVFETSALISEIHAPILWGFIGMLPTSIMVILGFCGLEFFKEYVKLEKIRLEDQLSFLKSQVNPHLTFNVLNHIHILIPKNAELADELLVKFSNVLRYQLYECNNDVVLLDTEIQYIKDVVEIEKMRWGNDLDVQFHLNIENGMPVISPLMFISFIENAFKHVSRLPGKKGYVHIEFNQKDDIICLIVENSKSINPPHKKDNSGLGLINTKKRLDISYPDKHRLDIYDMDTTYKIILQISL